MGYAIVSATHHLTENGLCYNACPLLIRDGMLDPSGSCWLMHVWRENSPDTAASYAAGLKSWLTWLDWLGIDRWAVNVDDLSRYKRTLLGKRASSTINVRIAAICAFYKWAFACGHTPILPFKLALKSSRRSQGGVAEIAPIKIFMKIPATHTKREYDTILGATRRVGTGTRFRDTLIAEFGRYVGLRRMEIAGLTTEAIENATRFGEFYRLDLSLTKGRKPRSVIVPSLLMHRVQRYIEIFRKRIVEAASVKHASSEDRRYRAPTALFLTSYGHPLRRQYISQNWAECAKASNIPSTFHKNRHTFGTGVVKECRRAGLHPRRVAQDLLGHEREETTAIYDHSYDYDDEETYYRTLVQRISRA